MCRFALLHIRGGERDLAYEGKGTEQRSKGGRERKKRGRKGETHYHCSGGPWS